MWSENMLYDFNSSTCIDTCIMAWHMVYSGEYSCALVKKYAFCYCLVKYSIDVIDVNDSKLTDSIVRVSFIPSPRYWLVRSDWGLQL